ncbi:MAG TPA: polysaccharide deacetylase family protein [Mycobacteriales bacterium]|nr:polysaccharide deacetylase family protein [Mycobacteriales bacterium]
MADPDSDAAGDGDAAAPAVTRRGLLRGGVGLGLSMGAMAGGAAAAGVSYADTGATRHRAFAVKAEPRMPSSTRLLWRAQTDEPVLALTFDDGPDPAYTVPLLETLAEHDVQATFFLVGERAVQHRNLLRRQLAGRHELGNHTWGHTDLSMLSRAETRLELGRTSQVIHDISGTAPAVLRPPWGRISGTAMHIAAEQAMDVMVWDVRLLEADRDAAGNVEHVLGELRPGMVLLAHDAGPGRHSIGVAAMPGIIRGAKARGFRFVTASEMLALDRTVADR